MYVLVYVCECVGICASVFMCIFVHVYLYVSVKVFHIAIKRQCYFFYNEYLIIQCILVTNLLKYLNEKHGNCVLTFESET